ncbi:MAG: 30S ribosome-binding factor RbfA [Verrucomicrobia bacterium]|nr:30S ribosome-binding factor RbfA [Verrucomicrobiota bacterium]MBV9658883.1 30S ribosome-binding factor RbfA [Verrucomicrobiota bacterium]
MKFRPNRVRELIQRELGALIQREMTFDAKLVTVHGVDLTPDFKNCHVYISAIGTADERRDAVQKLAAHRAHLQHELSRRVILKYTPALHFHLDDSIERGVRVTAILNEIDTVLPPPENPEPEWAREEDVQLFPDHPAYRRRDDHR